MLGIIDPELLNYEKIMHTWGGDAVTSYILLHLECALCF